MKCQDQMLLSLLDDFFFLTLTAPFYIDSSNEIHKNIDLRIYIFKINVYLSLAGGLHILRFKCVTVDINF